MGEDFGRIRTHGNLIFYFGNDGSFHLERMEADFPAEPEEMRGLYEWMEGRISGWDPWLNISETEEPGDLIEQFWRDTKQSSAWQYQLGVSLTRILQDAWQMSLDPEQTEEDFIPRALNLASTTKPEQASDFLVSLLETGEYDHPILRERSLDRTWASTIAEAVDYSDRPEMLNLWNTLFRNDRYMDIAFYQICRMSVEEGVERIEEAYGRSNTKTREGLLPKGLRILVDTDAAKSVKLIREKVAQWSDERLADDVIKYMDGLGHNVRKVKEGWRGVPYHLSGVAYALRASHLDLDFLMQEQTTRDNIRRVLCGGRNRSYSTLGDPLSLFRNCPFS